MIDHVNEIPVDLAAVQATDEWLCALNDAFLRQLGDSVDTDAELARVLLAWRRDVDTEPFGELLDTDTGVSAVKAGRRTHRRRVRAASFLGKVILSMSRRAPALVPDHDCRPAVAAELHRIADEMTSHLVDTSSAGTDAVNGEFLNGYRLAIGGLRSRADRLLGGETK